MPDGKHAQGFFARKKGNAFREIFQLAEEVAVAQHDAFGLAGCSGRKNDCGDVVPATFFNFRFDFGLS